MADKEIKKKLSKEERMAARTAKVTYFFSSKNFKKQ
jgi:hypothetical protein